MGWGAMMDKSVIQLAPFRKHLIGRKLVPYTHYWAQKCHNEDPTTEWKGYERWALPPIGGLYHLLKRRYSNLEPTRILPSQSYLHAHLASPFYPSPYSWLAPTNIQRLFRTARFEEYEYQHELPLRVGSSLPCLWTLAFYQVVLIPFWSSDFHGPDQYYAALVPFEKFYPLIQYPHP